MAAVTLQEPVAGLGRAALEDQRAFLLSSLADLDAEWDAGDIAEDDYLALKDDYTARAAAVLRALDRLDGRPAAGAGPVAPSGRRSPARPRPGPRRAALAGAGRRCAHARGGGGGRGARHPHLGRAPPRRRRQRRSRPVGGHAVRPGVQRRPAGQGARRPQALRRRPGEGPPERAGPQLPAAGCSAGRATRSWWAARCRRSTKRCRSTPPSPTPTPSGASCSCATSARARPCASSAPTWPSRPRARRRPLRWRPPSRKPNGRPPATSRRAPDWPPPPTPPPSSVPRPVHRHPLIERSSA